MPGNRFPTYKGANVLAPEICQHAEIRAKVLLQGVTPKCCYYITEVLLKPPSSVSSQI